MQSEIKRYKRKVVVNVYNLDGSNDQDFNYSCSKQHSDTDNKHSKIQDQLEDRLKEQDADKTHNTFVSKQCDNYNFWLSERDFYPPEDNRYHCDKKSVLGSKNMYVQYLSEFYDYYKECFEDMFEE